MRRIDRIKLVAVLSIIAVVSLRLGIQRSGAIERAQESAPAQHLDAASTTGVENGNATGEPGESTATRRARSLRHGRIVATALTFAHHGEPGQVFRMNTPGMMGRLSCGDHTTWWRRPPSAAKSAGLIGSEQKLGVVANSRAPSGCSARRETAARRKSLVSAGAKQGWRRKAAPRCRGRRCAPPVRGFPGSRARSSRRLRRRPSRRSKPPPSARSPSGASGPTTRGSSSRSTLSTATRLASARGAGWLEFVLYRPEKRPSAAGTTPRPMCTGESRQTALQGDELLPHHRHVRRSPARGRVLSGAGSFDDDPGGLAFGERPAGLAERGEHGAGHQLGPRSINGWLAPHLDGG